MDEPTHVTMVKNNVDALVQLVGQERAEQAVKLGEGIKALVAEAATSASVPSPDPALHTLPETQSTRRGAAKAKSNTPQGQAGQEG